MMSTTRPIPGSEPIKEVGSKRVQQVKVDHASKADRSSTSESREVGSATVAESVQSTRRLMEVAQEEFSSADEKMIEELKTAIKEGRFKVDPDRLAARMVADALGELEGGDE